MKPSRGDVRKKKPRKKEKEVHFKKLPVPSKKNQFSGRVREKANVMKRHYNVTLRDIYTEPDTTAKKSKLDALKVNKEKSKVAGCDFQQRESAKLAEDTTGETLGDDKESAKGTYAHEFEAPTAIPGRLQINVTGANEYSPVCKPGCRSSLSAHASFQSPCKIKYTAEDVNDTNNLNSGSECQNHYSNKTGRFILSDDDVKIIESGDSLTDPIIGAAHSVLRD